MHSTEPWVSVKKLQSFSSNMTACLKLTINFQLKIWKSPFHIWNDIAIIYHISSIYYYKPTIHRVIRHSFIPSINRIQHEKPVWRIAPCSFSNRCPSHHHSCHTHTLTLSERTAHAYGLIPPQLNHRDNTSAFKPFVSRVTDNSYRSSFIALNLFVSCSQVVEWFITGHTVPSYL